MSKSWYRLVGMVLIVGALCTAGCRVEPAAKPQSGPWNATSELGSFTFTVTSDGQAVRDIQASYTCPSGSVTIRETVTLPGPDAGWPISGGGFTVNEQEKAGITIVGQFNEEGTQASGTWKARSCSGSWQATPGPAAVVTVSQVAVVARVNGVELTNLDLDREMRHAVAYYQAQFNIDLNDPANAAQLAQVRKESLERIIDQELVRQIAEGRFPPPAPGQTPVPVVTVTEEEVAAQAQEYEAQAGGDRQALLDQNGFASYEEFIEFVRGNLRVQKLAEQYGLGEQVHARHILVATEEEARQVLARLRGGEDFAALAQELSKDQGSAGKGGDLGWFGRGAMVAPFEAAAFSLQVNQYSEPVQTQFGFHIIQVLEKGLRPDAQAFQAWFNRIKAQAQIERLVP